MVYDSLRSRVIVFAGHDGISERSDLWAWDSATRTWVELFIQAGGPGPRTLASMAHDPNRDRFVVFGRVTCYNVECEQTWEFDPNSHLWTAFGSSSLGDLEPGGRIAPQLAYDPNRRRMILFGGRTHWGSYPGGTFEWTGSRWSLITSDGPQGRWGHKLVTDHARNRLVLFGGYDHTANNYAQAFYPETWEWDGLSWSLRAATGPGARVAPGLAWDAARGVTVLFSGEGYPPDTWEWNGATWTQRATVASPPAGENQLVWDGRNVMLFSSTRYGPRPHPYLLVSLDSTPPSIQPVVNPAPSPGGWNRTDVTVSWTVSDPESAISTSSGCGAVTLSADSAGTTLTCTATNAAGLSGSASVTVRLDKTPPAISALPAPLSNAAGWNNSNVTVTFTCSDALSGVSLLSNTATTLSASGPAQSALATCRDFAGNETTGGIKINIDKAPPVTNSITLPNPIHAGSPGSISAGLSDGGGSGLFSADFTINGSAPAPLGTPGGATATVSGSLPALAAGVYDICVRGTDAAGNIGAYLCSFLAAFDPSAGFVTGGGWIHSPPGAYTGNPAATGEAHFAFVSRYHNGAQLPSGQTKFRFRAGNLNFESTSYDWLVIAGSRAQFRGVGAINGTAGYQFLLTAIDGGLPGGGGVDRLRLKIWGPGGVVYDNEIAAADSAAPITALGGGSIVIHKD